MGPEENPRYWYSQASWMQVVILSSISLAIYVKFARCGPQVVLMARSCLEHHKIGRASLPPKERESALEGSNLSSRMLFPLMERLSCCRYPGE